MVRARTLIVTVPPLLRTLVLGVLQPHFNPDIVATLDTRDGLPERLPDLTPDLLVLGLRPGEDDSCALPLLRAVPEARILVLAPDGTKAWLYEMRPHRSAITPFSVSSLVGSLQHRLDEPPSMS